MWAGTDSKALLYGGDAAGPMSERLGSGTMRCPNISVAPPLERLLGLLTAVVVADGDVVAMRETALSSKLLCSVNFRLICSALWFAVSPTPFQRRERRAFAL